MNKPHVLANICTKGRYHTTLPLAIAAIATQSVTPDKLLIYDDDQHLDLRNFPEYVSLFQLLAAKNIGWEVVFGVKLGQHYGHQLAQEKAEELVWRVDDDVIPEPRCLETLLKHFKDSELGAVGGLVLMNPYSELPEGIRSQPQHANRIIDALSSPNWQQFKWIGEPISVEHLHCTFLYRKGLAQYNLGLSRVAHTEETQFTHEIYRAGYSLLLDPNPNAVCWHLKHPTGGIRSDSTNIDFEHDMHLFARKMASWQLNPEKSMIIYLDNGIGDHYCLKSILTDIAKNFSGKIVLAACFKTVFENHELIKSGRIFLTGLGEVANLISDPTSYNVYAVIARHGCNLTEGYKKLYRT